MEAVLFCGVQASGKSTFYRQRFAPTHAHISLDVLKTRKREALALRACLEAGMPFVVDNTNPQSSTRLMYISAAKTFGFRVVGFYFRSNLQDALTRNNARQGKECVPIQGVLGTYNSLQIPQMSEGFNALFYVQIEPDGAFSVHPWKDEL